MIASTFDALPRVKLRCSRTHHTSERVMIGEAEPSRPKFQEILQDSGTAIPAASLESVCA